MITAALPDGQAIPVSAPSRNPLHTSRVTGFRYDLLGRDGQKTGELDGVSAGSLQWAANAQVKGGGQITVSRLSNEIDWLQVRVRPVMLIEGLPEQPLGVFIPSAPVEQRDESSGRRDVELLDRTSVISQDAVEQTYVVLAGSNVLNAVHTLVQSTGEIAGAFPTASDVTASTLTWKAGTSKLTIINELLDASGFFGLWVDSAGQFRVDKYLDPASRPVVYEMYDDDNSIYIPTLSVDRDIYSIPNKVIMVSQGSGDNSAMVAAAYNQNPRSPFSFQNRGRWITDTQSGVEATSMANLQSKANARLRALTSVQAAIDVQHAPLPSLQVNDVVRFRCEAASVDGLFTVTKTALTLGATDLQKTSLTEVIAL